MRITEAPICLHTCTGRSAPVLFANSPEDRFSLVEDQFLCQRNKLKKTNTINFFESYEGCSNVNASSFISFFTYMPRQNSKRFYKGLYVTFELAPAIKTNTVYLSSYSPLNEGHVSIQTI